MYSSFALTRSFICTNFLTICHFVCAIYFFDISIYTLDLNEPLMIFFCLGMVTSKVGKRHALSGFEALQELFIARSAFPAVSPSHMPSLL
jgi:hypothetical protein